jgi:hypothetical protein
MSEPTSLTFAEKIAKSSQVRYVEYNFKTRQLSIVFRRTPALYVYSGFGIDAWEHLQNADSIGSYLYKFVTKPLNGVLPYQFEKRELPEELREPE